MEAGGFSNEGRVGATTLGRYKLSWIAYIQPLVVLVVCSVSAVLIAIFLAAFPPIAPIAALVIFLAGFLYFLYYFLKVRSITLFYDENGVWLESGILPWSKGVVGIKWQDMEDASYMKGFKSWILDTYSVRIGHRFTRTSEILVSNLANGDDAVVQINKYHQGLISSQKIAPKA